MSFLLRKESDTLRIAPRLSKTAINQLEVLRRAFEIKTPELIAEILEEGIANEFDARMAEVEALPGLDTPEPEASPADRYLAAVLSATRQYFREALDPERQIYESSYLPDVRICRALSHAAANCEDPALAFMRFAAIGSTAPGGNDEVDTDPEFMIGAGPAEDAA